MAVVPLFINGKFTAQRTTGVQRFAWQTVLALDRVAPDALAARTVLLVPPGARPPLLRRLQVEEIGSPMRALHPWEQLVLPAAARRGWLLNLAGSSPWLGRRQVGTLFDAAVFDRPDAYGRIFAAWYRQLFRRRARQRLPLLTISEFSRERLSDRLGVAPDRLAVIPAGCDHLDGVAAAADALARWNLRPEGYLLAVGSLNPTKDLHTLTEAFARLDRALDLDLVLVGGSHRAVFAAGGAPIATGATRVTRTGRVDDETLKALYEGALALVFPSVYEGFGLPPLEAMACGCPVVVARTAPMPEVCGDAALYFCPGDAADLAAVLGRLAVDPVLRGQMRAQGTRRAAQFGWERSARLLLPVLENVMS